MMSVLGDLFIAASIIGGAVIFVVANVNYVPEKDNEE